MVYDPDPTVVALADRGLPHGGFPGQVVVRSGSAAYESEWRPNVADTLFDITPRPATWGHYSLPIARTAAAMFGGYEWAGSMWLEAGERVTGLVMGVTTAVAGSTIEVGLREGPALLGGTNIGDLLFSAGNVDGGSATTQTVTLATPWTCPATGLYWTTSLTRNGAPSVRQYAGNPATLRVNSTAAAAVGASVPVGVIGHMSNQPPAGGLAVSASHFNMTTNGAPVIAVKIG